jgi:hypothetical protein
MDITPHSMEVIKLKRRCQRAKEKLFLGGTPINDKLNIIEDMFIMYGVKEMESEKSREPTAEAAPPAGDPATRKRMRSEDSGIGLEEQRKRRRVSTPSPGRGPQLRALNAVADTEGRPKGARHVQFAHADLVDVLNDDDAYEADTDEDDARSNASPTQTDTLEMPDSARSTRSNDTASTRPTYPAPIVDASTTTTKRRPGRPRKVDSNKSSSPRNRKGEVKAKGTVKASPRTPIFEAPRVPCYNGRGRPAHMPFLPYPEGIDEIVWMSQSYRAQKDRLAGLKLLAEMETESSEWENSSDEE